MNNNRPKRRHRPRLDSDVDDLGLTTRASNALYFARIQTVGDLLRNHPSELLQLRNIGKATLRLIEQAVRAAKLNWKDYENQ